MRRASMILCCLLAIAAAGCGSSTGTGGPSSSQPSSDTAATGVAGPTVVAGSSAAAVPAGSLPAACSLLTKAEIEGAVGHPVMDATGSGEDCQWPKVDQHQISVSLHVHALPGTLPCQTVGGVPITDLGAEAGWHYLANLYTGSVTACTTGRVQAQVTLVGDLVTHTTTEDELRTDAVALMRLVLPRL